MNKSIHKRLKMISRFLNLSNDFHKVSYFLSLESCLNLSRECNSLSYDAMTAHTAVVFTRYMMLSLESRESNDNRSLGELFYTFLTKCLISHGYRLFKCCFKCSEQCFQITLNFQTKKSMNWRMHLWMHFLLDENTTAGCIKAEYWQLNNCQILNFQGA